MKQVLIFSAVCAAIFITGYAEAKEIYAHEAAQTRVDQCYAPTVSIGQFTSSLAGSGRIRSEIFMLIKDRVYDDLAGAEGELQFAGDINRTFSAGGR